MSWSGWCSIFMGVPLIPSPASDRPARHGGRSLSGVRPGASGASSHGGGIGTPPGHFIPPLLSLQRPEAFGTAILVDEYPTPVETVYRPIGPAIRRYQSAPVDRDFALHRQIDRQHHSTTLISLLLSNQPHRRDLGEAQFVAVHDPDLQMAKPWPPAFAGVTKHGGDAAPDASHSSEENHIRRSHFCLRRPRGNAHTRRVRRTGGRPMHLTQPGRIQSRSAS